MFLAHDRTEKVQERNQAFYAKFPEDILRVKNIMDYLENTTVALPSGQLTPARFQQLGILFGFHGMELFFHGGETCANSNRWP